LASDILTVNGIDAFYGDSHVLHGVGFALRPGRLLGLLGRNGAGKTTCMSTVMGFLRPRRGSISLCGEPVGGLPPETISRKGIALVPQGRRIFRTLTVRENLIVAAQPAGRHGSGAAWSLDRAFATFPRLKERAQQTAGLLSGGEQQMLAIGRALMGKPRLLLLDEPSMGIAPILVERIYETIAEINQQGMTILLVEQNANFALEVSSRGYVLETGAVSLADESASLRNNPDVQKAYLGQ
jgi:branched-chain amino acid transport system ATP-binding protein